MRGQTTRRNVQRVAQNGAELSEQLPHHIDELKTLVTIATLALVCTAVLSTTAVLLILVKE
jgi:uncharacterized protein with beta-barrel porin domain